MDADMLRSVRMLRRYWRSFTPAFRAWLRTVDAATPLDEVRRAMTAERDRSRTDPALMGTGEAYAGWALLNPLLDRLADG